MYTSNHTIWGLPWLEGILQDHISNILTSYNTAQKKKLNFLWLSYDNGLGGLGGKSNCDLWKEKISVCVIVSTFSKKFKSVEKISRNNMCLYYIVWSVRVRAIYSLLRVHDRAFRIESLVMGNLQNLNILKIVVCSYLFSLDWIK